MKTPVFLLLTLNYAAIALLPIVFFRRDGVFNIRWMLTALPFFAGAGALLLAWLSVLPAAIRTTPSMATGLESAAVILSGGSIGLLSLTIGVHRVPLALWHQDNDDPVQLVTWGPYSRIRHPFYTSFLLAFGAALLAFPHPATLIIFAYGSVALTVTAGREETRLSTSRFGEEYRRYWERTGRFFPKLSGRTHE